MTGQAPSWLHFEMAFMDVNLGFFSQHLLGSAGEPTFYADYPDAFTGWNFVSLNGSDISAAGLLLFLVMSGAAFARKRQAGENPWLAEATTLEWKLSSPPRFHQFAELPGIC